MRITEDRIPKKMLNTKMEGKRLRGQSRNRLKYRIRKDIEIKEGNGKKHQKIGRERREVTGKLSIGLIVDPYHWKRLKNDGDDGDI